LRFGNARFGEKYKRAARITGYDTQTLANYVYVAAHFAIPQRRPDISWSHHAELAKFDADDQVAWLMRVVADHLSVKDLRREVRNVDPAIRGIKAMRPVVVSAPLCPTCGQPVVRRKPTSAPIRSP
jgi:hypothetical protein